jgi:hypothetical protein
VLPAVIILGLFALVLLDRVAGTVVRILDAGTFYQHDLPIPLLGYTRAIIYRACVEQAYYRRPWASEEDIQKQDPKFKVRLDWGEKKDKNG